PSLVELGGLFAGILFGLQKGRVELIDFFGFLLRLRTDHAKRLRFRGARNRSRLRWFGLRLGTFGLDGLRGGAKVALDFSFFALRHAFPENVLIFCVRLRQVVEAEALPVL